ncbi:unnamed protein product [Coffea canephora]|uniref:Uncharacterized protein n=1 Tax=Coffea canephora TaxID=49390 RepID=A0A068UB22_COFCA|nr:unnamed protein product [Coffea canephora]
MKLLKLNINRFYENVLPCISSFFFFFFSSSHSSGNRNPQYLLLNQIPPASSSPPILLHILFLPIKFTRKDNTPRFRERLKRILQSPFFAILVRIKKLTGLSSLFRYWGYAQKQISC